MHGLESGDYVVVAVQSANRDSALHPDGVLSRSEVVFPERLDGAKSRVHSGEPVRSRRVRQNLTAYDAAYVALSEGLGATLLTRDAHLADAPGHRADVELI